MLKVASEPFGPSDSRVVRIKDELALRNRSSSGYGFAPLGESPVQALPILPGLYSLIGYVTHERANRKVASAYVHLGDLVKVAFVYQEGKERKVDRVFPRNLPAKQLDQFYRMLERPGYCSVVEADPNRYLDHVTGDQYYVCPNWRPECMTCRCDAGHCHGRFDAGDTPHEATADYAFFAHDARGEHPAEFTDLCMLTYSGRREKPIISCGRLAEGSS